MTNKILRRVAVLALYGGLVHAGYCSTSGGLSSPIDSEGFTAEQKRDMQQTAKANLIAKEPLLSSTTEDDARGGDSKADGNSKGGNAITNLAVARGGNATSQNGTAEGGKAFANKKAHGGDAISDNGAATGGTAIAGKLSADEIKQLKELGMI